MSEVVLITGAGSGLGLAMAELLARAGLSVCGAIREPESRNREVAQHLRSLGATIVHIDVCSEASVHQGVEIVLSTHGHVDVLINNAGRASFGLLESFTPEQFQMMLDTNVLGAVRMNRAVLPSMRSRGSGLLIHMSSVAGRIAVPFLGPYSLSKWALEALAETYRLELAPCGIDSIVIEPGKYPTGIVDRMEEAQDSQRAASYGSDDKSPEFRRAYFDELNRLEQKPADLAAIVLTLIRTPFGLRPFRTLIGGDAQPLAAYNRTAERTLSSYSEKLGLKQKRPPDS